MKKFLPRPLADFYQGLMLACGAGCLMWLAMLLVRFPSMWLIVLAWFGTILLMAQAIRWVLRRQRPVTEPTWYLILVAAAVWGLSLLQTVTMVRFFLQHTTMSPAWSTSFAPDYIYLLVVFLSGFLIFRITLGRSLWQSAKLLFLSWAMAILVGFPLYFCAIRVTGARLERGADHLLGYMVCRF